MSLISRNKQPVLVLKTAAANNEQKERFEWVALKTPHNIQKRIFQIQKNIHVILLKLA